MFQSGVWLFNQLVGCLLLLMRLRIWIESFSLTFNSLCWWVFFWIHVLKHLKVINVTLGLYQSDLCLIVLLLKFGSLLFILCHSLLNLSHLLRYLLPSLSYLCHFLVDFLIALKMNPLIGSLLFELPLLLKSSNTELMQLYQLVHCLRIGGLCYCCIWITS